MFIAPEVHSFIMNASSSALQGDMIDIFQLGVTLLHMLLNVGITGKAPFKSAVQEDPVYRLFYRSFEGKKSLELFQLLK